MSRTILHVDLNNYYAGVECLYRPELRDKPITVCGDAEARHGIVLAKNYPAKALGIKTGETIWQAKQKCPNLIMVSADFVSLEWPERYMPTTLIKLKRSALMSAG